MKERIFSIMDMRKKKSGLVVLCGILILTLGTGFTFGANAKTQDPPTIIQEDIKEDITVSPRPRNLFTVFIFRNYYFR